VVFAVAVLGKSPVAVWGLTRGRYCTKYAPHRTSLLSSGLSRHSAQAGGQVVCFLYTSSLFAAVEAYAVAWSGWRCASCLLCLMDKIRQLDSACVAGQMLDRPPSWGWHANHTEVHDSMRCSAFVPC
jgi:hypothetical protein